MTAKKRNYTFQECKAALQSAASVGATLAERGARYGDFMGHAVITQELKDAMARGRRWNDLRPDQREALEMIVHKIGRILNGDPAYVDSWHDISGYAKLVEDRLALEALRNGEKV